MANVFSKDDNFNPTIGGVSSATNGSPKSFRYNPTTRGMETHEVSGIALPAYDYVSMALSGGDTTETYTFKSGGSGGTTVATVVIVYTDNTRAVLSSVTKT